MKKVMQHIKKIIINNKKDYKMGMSEWGFRIKSNNDIEKIMALIKAHNTCTDFELVGEGLYIYGIIKENKTDNIYICCANGGGRDNTRVFLENNYEGEILWPFEKPKWWGDTRKHMFISKIKCADKEIVSPFDGKIYINNVK